jgi:Family of unknown function (DUF6452)
MRKFIAGSLIIIVPGIIIFLSSCTTGSCFEETECYVKASFYKNTTRTPPDSLTLYGINNDSIIYNQSRSIQPALIPLNSSANSCTFIIEINGKYDTIEFRYTNYPHLISRECGYTFYHHLDTIIPHEHFHAIERIEYINKTITNLNAENIRIIY